jgi:signal transduction histidine kinase
VSNLITFSDSRKSSIEEFNLVELLEQLIGLITYNARYKNIDIAFMKSSDRVPIKANKTEIKQAILNIMKNSFEAMPDGGTLTIRTETVPVNGFSEARIQFTDTGPGIREERIQSIFLPFFSTKDGPQQNMGLGLSISYGIIKKYRGAITVKNVEPPSTGCTFTVKIPV